MFKITLYAITPSKKIPYNCYMKLLDLSNTYQYMEPTQCINLCKTGCINFGKKWSCPPFSPKFVDYCSNYTNLIVLMLQVELSNLNYIKNDYLKIKAANSILKSRLEKTVRSFIDKDTHYILSGSCRLCTPCKKKLNQGCANPTLMSYSYEALGINVSKLIKDCFDIELQWYSKKQLPDFTCTVGGILTNNKISFDSIITTLASYN